MSTHKHFDKICYVVLAFTLILAVLFVNAEHFGVQKASTVMGYEKTLFDTSRVHTINIIMDDWEDFSANCKSEEYYNCTVVIDNEAYKNVAIRGKGNTSLSMVSNNRYSYKIEFDHYDNTNTYHGLDKLCLNNIIQDNTYMKDYLTYQMMNKMGVAAPLCSYVYITVNGEEWGLYLAVEGVEESFLQRNYGKNYGELYKPDSMNMGGGRGNGEKFDIDEFLEESESGGEENGGFGNFPRMPSGSQVDFGGGQMPEEFEVPEGFEVPDDFTAFEGMTPFSNTNGTEGAEQNSRRNWFGGGFGGMMKSNDVLLKYTDDSFESYSNIFNSAKTDITDADKTRLINALRNLSNGENLDSTVDIDSVIRYFVVHNYVVNFDSYTGSMIHNYYLYEKDGQMQMIPWDYNLAFGGFQSMGDATSLVNYPIDSPVSNGNTSDRPMLAWIFENEEHTELYHQYFSEFITSCFDSGYFSETIDTVNAMISPYVEKDSTKFCTYSEFQIGVSTLKEFCFLRAKSVSAQLDGTIGSTTDTQDSYTLIDAGYMQIDDMGSMGSVMGGNMQRPQSNNNFGDESESLDGNSWGGFRGGGMPDSFGGEQAKRPDDNSQPNSQEQGNIFSTQWLIVAASILVLAAGLVLALTYKRRN